MSKQTMSVVLDGTPLDSKHRHRGIGRYVQGILQGFSDLHSRDELDFSLKVLRLSHRPADASVFGFDEIRYSRFANTHARDMFLENVLRLDHALPDDTAVYHGTAMEGYSAKSRFVATCHDLIPLVLQGKYLRRRALAERLFWNRYVETLRNDATRIVAISQHVKRTLVERFGVNEDKIEVIYHGLSPFWSQPSGDSLRLSLPRPVRPGAYVLFVGGFDERKGFDRAVQAIQQIPERVRPELVVVGKRGKLEQKEHRRLLRRYQADAIFLEKVSDEDLRSLYHHALCLVFPSIEEGWGFPIVEAMAAGTAVICAGFGSMKEAADGAAMEVDVRSVEDLSHSIRVLMSDSNVRRRLIEAGKQRVKRLSWADNARWLIEVYRSAYEEVP